VQPLDRVVVAASSAKAFGATGGALVLPTAELRDRVRRCGGPMMFSGPLVPSVLGTALASARLHLRPEFEQMQGELHERLAFASEGLAAAGLELATDARTPVRVLHCASVPAAQAVVRTMRDRGFFMCISTFPAVPVNKPSVRFTISRHNSFADIREMIDRLAEAKATADERAGVDNPAAV
jgi:7-keto-8-aminopelargonate synthetase-like enzyme